MKNGVFSLDVTLLKWIEIQKQKNKTEHFKVSWDLHFAKLNNSYKIKTSLNIHFPLGPGKWEFTSS